MASKGRSDFFASLDTSVDGTLSRVEWSRAFDRIDADRDGSVSRKQWYSKGGNTEMFDELQRGNKSTANIMRKEWLKFFDQLDADHDGKVSRVEFLAEVEVVLDDAAVLTQKEQSQELQAAEDGTAAISHMQGSQDFQEAVFSVTVQTISGDSYVVENLSPSDQLQALRARVAETLQIDRGMVKLLHGSRTFQPSERAMPLSGLGIVPGTVMSCEREWLREGMKFEVRGAGTDRVNGTYTCLTLESWFQPVVQQGHQGALYLKKDDAEEVISWHAADADNGWPAAWYMQDRYDCYGIYFLPSRQPDVIPLDDWEVYAGTWSKPGVHPMPQIDLLDA